MIFNTKEKGLGTIFKDWEIEVLEVVKAAKEPLGSRAVHDAVWRDNTARPECQISRASVINFLAEMEREKILVSIDSTGKGGHRSLYSPNLVYFSTFSGLRLMLGQRIIDAVKQELHPLVE